MGTCEFCIKSAQGCLRKGKEVTEKRKFQKGDRVRFGEVKGVLEKPTNQPVRTDELYIELPSGIFVSFTLDGKLSGYPDAGVMIELIEPAPEEKRHVKFEGWANIYSDGFWCAHISKSDADSCVASDRIDCTPFLYDSKNPYIQIRKRDLDYAVNRERKFESLIDQNDYCSKVWQLLKERSEK